MDLLNALLTTFTHFPLRLLFLFTSVTNIFSGDLFTKLSEPALIVGSLIDLIKFVFQIQESVLISNNKKDVLFLARSLSLSRSPPPPGARYETALGFQEAVTWYLSAATWYLSAATRPPWYSIKP